MDTSETSIIRTIDKDFIAKILVDFDDSIQNVYKSQEVLETELNNLVTTLRSIHIDENLTEDISKTARRVVALKRRMTLVNTIINNSKFRCRSILEANNKS